MKCSPLKPDSIFEYSDLHPMKWDTYVDGKPVDVYSVSERYHTIGGRYGVSDLYACPRGELPTAKNLIPFNGEAVDWGMNIQHNTHIHKDSIESNIQVCITRNSKPFYSFSVNDLNFGLAKAQMILTFATEGPIWFSCQNFVLNEIIGRKIRYKGKKYTAINSETDLTSGVLFIRGWVDFNQLDIDTLLASKTMWIDIMDNPNIEWA